MNKCVGARNQKLRQGFTIVELLIVVVVIAILAAITIVAYNGITDRAKASAAQLAAKQALTKIMTYTVANNDQYPTDLAAAGITGLEAYQYRVDNTANPKTFCLTATNQNVSYWLSNSANSPSAGACVGHAANGGQVITNLANDPRATTLTVSAGGSGWTAANWYGSGGSGTYSIVTGASDGPNGIGTYVRKQWSITPTNNASSGIRNTNSSTNGLVVSPNQTYTFSSYLRSSKLFSNATMMRVEWSDQSGTQISVLQSSAITLAANAWVRISVTATAPSNAVYVGVISHVSGGTDNWAPGDRLDGTGLMITTGSTLQPYADGNTAGWAWTGAPNASPSSGSPL